MRMYFGLEMLRAGEVNANGPSPRLRVNENRYFPDRRFMFPITPDPYLDRVPDLW
jgi:hypothetical protein